MPGGLVALLDDVAAIAKVAAASVDDVALASGRAATKAAGVVIDDAAVTPRYVVGLSPARELPIIAKIAVGSLRNKLLILLPAALVLSAFLPWAITPILMAGGAFLCFEAAEKILEKLTGAHHGDEAVAITDPKVLEDRQVSGAIRTDLILSGEIMAITLAELGEMSIGMQAVVLAIVGVAITVAVYGAVGLIVKMDDIGLHLAGRASSLARTVGRGLVALMPRLLAALAIIGTAAMVWVGGGILIHGLEAFGVHGFPDWLHGAAHAAGEGLPVAGSVVEWIVGALGAAAVGLVVGAVIVGVAHLVPRRH